MNTAVGLLLLAISLLQAVRDNPSLPPEVRDQAVVVANQAISYTTTYLKEQGLATSSLEVPTNVSVTVTPAAQAPAPQNEAPAPLPSVEVLGSPSVLVLTRSTTTGSNMVKFQWMTTADSTADFHLCSQPTKCTKQATLPSATQHEYTLERPASTVEFYKVTHPSGATFSGQMPQ